MPKESVHEIGLEDILHLLLEDIPKCMGRWLLSNFDRENMCFQLENGLVVPIREEDVHYTLGLPRGGIITKRVVHLDRVVPCVVQSLHGWRSSHLKARQSVGVGSTGQEEDDTHPVRELVGGGTSVKTVDEEFVDKIGVLVAAVDDMLQFLECHLGQSSRLDTFGWVVSVACKILMLFDQSGRSVAEPHRNLGVGQRRWMTICGAIQTISVQISLHKDVGEVEVVVRQYDDVTLIDPLWGSKLDTPDRSCSFPTLALKMEPTCPCRSHCLSHHWIPTGALCGRVGPGTVAIPARGAYFLRRSDVEENTTNACGDHWEFRKSYQSVRDDWCRTSILTFDHSIS
nr:uncharacterized protein LOC109179738 isoform X2 [Ipomoea batatas]